MIEYCVEDVDKPLLGEELISLWIERVLLKYHKRIGELCYVFCSDPYILNINKTYLSHDYYTDIITFDYTEDEIVSGDLFISLDTVKSNALKFECVYKEELSRVIVHGILHMCGLKDKLPEEADQMRAAENEALILLKEIENEF